MTDIDQIKRIDTTRHKGSNVDSIITPYAMMCG